MAIYHCEVKIISRGKGRSAVGASAYRSGEKLYNEYDGIQHDYTNKRGIVYTEIQVPENAPEWAKDRERLWNEVEKIEKRKDSQLAREINVALPRELTKKQQIELVREYTKENFTDKGMVADIAIHDTGDGNPHAHIMLTIRPFNKDGNWGAKSEQVYILDKKGEKIKLKNGNYKTRKIDTTDWNKKETLEKWRENWAKTANKYLEKYNHKERIDHRSYEKQGIEKIPTIHEGPVARKIHKRGGQSTRMLENKKIREENEIIDNLNKEIQQLQRIQELQKQELTKLEEQEKELLKSKERDNEESIDLKERERDLEGPQIEVKTLKIDREKIKFDNKDDREDIGKDRIERGSITRLEGSATGIAETQISHKNMQSIYQQRKVELQDLNNAKHTIEYHEKILRDLERQKEQLRGIKGILNSREKKKLENEIIREKNLISKQEEFLQKQYSINRENLEQRINQVSKEVSEYEQHRESIKDKLERIATKPVERNREQDKIRENERSR